MISSDSFLLILDIGFIMFLCFGVVQLVKFYKIIEDRMFFKIVNTVLIIATINLVILYIEITLDLVCSICF